MLVMSNFVHDLNNGGYTERWLDAQGCMQTKDHKAGSIIVRSAQRAHRIEAVKEGCTTLFFALKVTQARGEQGWRLIKHPDVEVPPSWFNAPDGVYAVEGGGYRKRKDGIWYAVRETKKLALSCDRLSIRQDLTRVQKVGEGED